MVEAREGESFEGLLKRFKNEVAADRVLQQYKEHSRFETKRAKLQRKRARVLRAQRRRQRARTG